MSKTRNTTETALQKLEKLLAAEFDAYCAKAGPGADAEGFEQWVVPLMLADPELVEAATVRLKFLQSR
jgi:hypothetical protein